MCSFFQKLINFWVLSKFSLQCGQIEAGGSVGTCDCVRSYLFESRPVFLNENCVFSLLGNIVHKYRNIFTCGCSNFFFLMRGSLL